MTIKQIFIWLVILCRIAVGLVIVRTGFDFTSGSGAFAYQDTDVITGVFVISIGLYCIFSSLFGRLFNQSD